MKQLLLVLGRDLYIIAKRNVRMENALEFINSLLKTKSINDIDIDKTLDFYTKYLSHIKNNIDSYTVLLNNQIDHINTYYLSNPEVYITIEFGDSICIKRNDKYESYIGRVSKSDYEFEETDSDKIESLTSRVQVLETRLSEVDHMFKKTVVDISTSITTSNYLTLTSLIPLTFLVVLYLKR